METAGEGAEPVIEIVPLILVRQKLLELLHVALVADRIKYVPKLIVQLRQFPDFFPDIMDCSGQVLRVEAFKGALSDQRLIQFTQQPFIIDDEAKLLLLAVFLIEPVYAGDRLQKVVIAQ
jgi:hypothetical protein